MSFRRWPPPMLWAALILMLTSIPGSAALVFCFGALDEWHQQFIPQRSMDILDWAADTTAAAMRLIVPLAGERRPVCA